jgi:hypothetical protein
MLTEISVHQRYEVCVYQRAILPVFTDERKIIMRRNCDAMSALRYSIALVVLLAVSGCSVKLIDIDKSMPRLDLSEEQSKVVQPKMMAIREIAEKYELEKEELEEEINSARAGSKGSDTGGADRSELRGRFQEFRKRREAYLSAIKIHVADIRAVLSKEQVGRFEKMKLPELEMPEMRGGRRPSMGGRGGGGRGGRGGGGRGGGKF